MVELKIKDIYKDDVVYTGAIELVQTSKLVFMVEDAEGNSIKIGLMKIDGDETVEEIDNLISKLPFNKNVIIEVPKNMWDEKSYVTKEDCWQHHVPFNRGSRFRKVTNKKLLNNIRRQLTGDWKLLKKEEL